jgi:hypothetical protein
MKKSQILGKCVGFLSRKVVQVDLKILRTIKLNLLQCAVEREGNHELVIFLEVH